MKIDKYGKQLKDNSVSVEFHNSIKWNIYWTQKMLSVHLLDYIIQYKDIIIIITYLNVKN